MFGRRKRDSGPTISLGEVLDDLPQSRFAVVCLFLTLPFLQPFSLGPVATVGGLTFAALGLGHMRMRRDLRLPDKVRKIRISLPMRERLLRWNHKMHAFAARVSRPKLKGLVRGRAGRRLVGVLVILGGLLISVPFPGIPLNNTIPALAVACAAIGHVQRDGRWIFGSVFFLFASVAYFALLGYGVLKLADAAVK